MTVRNVNQGGEDRVRYSRSYGDSLLDLFLEDSPELTVYTANAAKPLR